MKKLTILTVVLCLFGTVYSQNADEENIKKVVRAETESYFNRDLQAWKAAWAKNANTNRTFISKYGYDNESKWDTSVARIEAQFKQSPAPQPMEISTSNYNILQKGEMAWVDYDQVLTGPGIDPATKNGYSHESRLLIKEGDEWKIVTQITTSPESYNMNNQQIIENDLNAAGYSLMNAKKLNDAIEVFKLNAKLYPDSWNTYDSLGEAYALAGDKKKAIENYEKSIKLNPKSESGPPALAKLKGK